MSNGKHIQKTDKGTATLEMHPQNTNGQFVNIFTTENRYNILYADPPWAYRVYSKKGQGRSAENHYPTMSMEGICALDIARICADDCILFLWVTFPCLQDSFKVLKAWGFTYKTCAFTWVKRNKKQTNTWFFGLGHWTRANPELCLLATKGHPKRLSAAVHSVVDTPIERHSKKPDMVRERIVQLCGDKPRIELFARETCAGWDCWGNEVGCEVHENHETKNINPSIYQGKERHDE